MCAATIRGSPSSAAASQPLPRRSIMLNFHGFGRIMQYRTDDLRIKEIKELLPPSHVLREFGLTEKAARTVVETRQQIHRVLHGADDRLVVIAGPCSIHDVNAAKEYAAKLADLRQKLGRELLILMRVYFEKPRTTVGWKGLINDPR